MYYVYFMFAGYRVAIGKTKNLKHRISNFKRTHYSIEILGVIGFDTNKQALEKEREILAHFKSDNAFRDMFYLSKGMLDHIAKHTEIPTSDMIRGYDREKQRQYSRKTEVKEKRKRYQQKPEVKEQHRKNEHVRSQTPEAIEKRQQYNAKPEVKERLYKYRRQPENKSKNREYQREWQRKRRQCPEYREKHNKQLRKSYYKRKNQPNPNQLSLFPD